MWNSFSTGRKTSIKEILIMYYFIISLLVARFFYPESRSIDRIKLANRVYLGFSLGAVLILIIIIF